MKIEKTLPGGARLECDMAPFQVGHRLMKSVMREIGKINVSLGIKDRTLKDIMDVELTDGAINTIKDVVTALIASEEVEAVLWECMGRATYNGRKMSPETFEDAAARADYLPVVKEVLFHNLSPFFKSLGSLLPGRSGQAVSTQR